MNQFAFDLNQHVKLSCSPENGEIVARAEYACSENTYLVRYKAGDGCAVESWWGESALESMSTTTF